MAAAAVAGGSEAAGEYPVLTERLSESAEAAGHGAATDVDDLGIGQDQANEADMEEATGYSAARLVSAGFGGLGGAGVGTVAGAVWQGAGLTAGGAGLVMPVFQVGRM